jgi:hypothetical protein
VFLRRSKTRVRWFSVHGGDHTRAA